MESHFIYPGWFPKDQVFPARLFEPGYLAPELTEKEWGDPSTRPAKGYRYLHTDARVNAPVPDSPCPVFGLNGDGIWYFGAYPATEDDLLYSPLKFGQAQVGALYGAKAITAALKVKVSLPTPADKIETNISGHGVGYDSIANQVIWDVSGAGGDDDKGNLNPDPQGTLTLAAARLSAGYEHPSAVQLATQCWYSQGTIYDRYTYRDFEQELLFSFARHPQTPAKAKACPVKWDAALLGKDIFSFARTPPLNWVYSAGDIKPMVPALIWMGGGLGGARTLCVVGPNAKPPDIDTITSDTAPTMNDDPGHSGMSWTLSVDGIAPAPEPGAVSIAANTPMGRWSLVGPEKFLDTSLFSPRPPAGFPAQIRVPQGGTANWLRAAGFMTQEQLDNYTGDPDSWTQMHSALGFNYQDILSAMTEIGEGVAYICRVQLGGGLAYGMMRHEGDNPGASPVFSFYGSNGYIDNHDNFRPMFKITLTAFIQNPGRGLNLNFQQQAAFFHNSKFFSSDKHDIAADNRILVGTITAFGQEVNMWGLASEAPGSIYGTVDFDGFSESYGLFVNHP